MNTNKKQRFSLSVLGGICMFIAFPFSGSVSPLMFLGFVPLLIIEAEIQRLKLPAKHFFIHSFITFLIFNIGTSWWIWNAHAGGAIFAFLFNTIIMCLTFQGFHFTRKHVGSRQGYLSLPFFWLGLEYLHNHWEFAHPWLTLGNTFSTRTSWIQWYEYTGVSGGSLWIVTINLIAFFIYRQWKQNKSIKRAVSLMFFCILFPIVASLYIGYNFNKTLQVSTKKKYINTVIVQPNIDPYNDKFDRATFYNQNLQILNLITSKTSKKTELIIAPETAISGSFLESRIESTLFYSMYKDRLQKWNTDLLIGASTMKTFTAKNSKSSLPMKNGGFYEYYNTSVLLRADERKQFIHKSKLVAGVEQIPYSQYIPFFEKLAIDNGGTVGSLGIEDSVQIMQTSFGKIAPIVCYESVFSEFVAEQARKGAQLLCVITNDGWWGNTPGYKQHFSFARLRAIENRKWLIRSANTGKSGVISPSGEVKAETNWWEPDVIDAKVQLLDIKTIFSQHGDYLGRSSAFLSVFILIFALSKKIKPNSLEQKSNHKEGQVKK